MENVAQSALEHVIAHGLPAVDEILFLRAARPWARSAIMGMKMRRPIHNGVLQGHMSLQPLMQVPCLCNVDGRPITIRQFASINVNPG